jgi:hypothetical protein
LVRHLQPSLAVSPASVHLRLLLGLHHRPLADAIATHSSLLEPRVYVPRVESARPPRQRQRHRGRTHGHRRNDQERLPVAARADAGDALPGHRRHGALPRRLPVVHPPGDADVEDVGADGAGHVADVVERGVVLEAEELGDDGQDHRVRRAEAEPHQHRRRVQRPGHAERDQQVPRHRQEEHARHQERPRELVPRQERLRGETGGDAAEVVPDADEGDEGGDAALRVAQRLADLAHVVDGRQRAAHAEHRRREQKQHVHAHQRLQDAVVLAARWRPQRGKQSRTHRRRRRLRGCGHGHWGQSRRVSLRFGRVPDVELEQRGLLAQHDADGEEEHREHDGGADAVLGAGEPEALLEDDGDHEESRERERNVQEGAERAVLPARRGGRARCAYDSDGAEEGDGDGSREPADEQDERLGVAAASGAVEGEVELGEDGAAEADEPFEEAEHDAAALGEVLDAGDERAGVGEGLRVGADGDVEADEPERRRGADAAGDGEVEHEVAAEVHGGADGEDDPRRGDLGDEAGVDADVGADVLEEADGVELLLRVPQRGLDVLGVDGEDVGGAGGGHDEEGAVRHEPAPAQHLRCEGRRSRWRHGWSGVEWSGVAVALPGRCFLDSFGGSGGL